MIDSDEILRRLEALEAVENIKQLKARYFRFVDEKNYGEFVALFAPGAKIVIDGATWESPAAMAEVMNQFIAGAPTVHHGHMPEIEFLGPDTASGIWAMEDLVPFQAGENIPDGHHGYGQYRETYRKIGGRWLIDSLTLTRFRVDPIGNWIPIS